MATNSNIEWTDHTFNPWIGCTKVSPGCAHCYAETLSARRKWATWGKGMPRQRTTATYWKAPLSWNKKAADTGLRPRVFCASLADWLDPEVPTEWRTELLELISSTPHLDWLLLTKRIELLPTNTTIPDNVWLGTSAEDQQRYDERVPALLSIPAKVHFVSAEPLLAPIIMGSHKPDWLIVGGESGPGARPIDPTWVRDLRDECRTTPCRFFFKQWGGINKKKTGRELDGETFNQFPHLSTAS